MGKAKAAARSGRAVRKRGVGRPRVEQPLVTTSLRFDAGMAAELDAWAKENGNMPRAAAIRLAVQRLLRGPKLGK